MIYALIQHNFFLGDYFGCGTVCFQRVVCIPGTEVNISEGFKGADPVQSNELSTCIWKKAGYLSRGLNWHVLWGI